MKMPTAQARTQDEILARIDGIVTHDQDPFGFRREVLIVALDYAHARPFLNPHATEEVWGDIQVIDTGAHARDYYAFAIGKIRSHRGISAERSVEKLREYAWLLGRDDVIEAMDAADFPQYGAPKVKAFGDGFDLGWPDEERLQRMAGGRPCADDCVEGCSW